MNVRDLMRRSAGFHRERTAIISGERRLSYGQAWERGLRMAQWLLSLGLRPGDRVGTLEDNSVGAADIFLGATIANLVRVPLYARNARSSHRYMLDHTDCRAVVVAENYAPQLADMREEVASLEHIVVRDGDYERRLAAFPAEDPEVPVRAEDPYVIRHTGGTTGKAKGVLFGHRAWLETGRNWFFTMPPVQVGDVCMHIAPISHASGYLFVPVWLMGGTNLLLEKFHPERTIDTMVRERVAYVFMAPTIVQDVLQVPGVADRDWSALKVLLIGAAPVTESMARRAHTIWNKALCQIYGQTEGSPVTTCMAADWIAEVPGSRPLQSLGRVHPFAEVRILDPDTHAELPYGAEGEIAYRVDGQMSGYWSSEESDRAMLHDGFVLSGDVGCLDQNGFLYMVDRKDDMIISGGFNIWPTEIENVLTAHPAVLEAVVFGVPHERFGEVPHALCKIRDAGAVTEQELIELCAASLGSYKKPWRVQLGTEPLPCTSVGKISRKQLRAAFWEGMGRRK